jgi:hypothetical protein
MDQAGNLEAAFKRFNAAAGSTVMHLRGAADMFGRAGRFRRTPREPLPGAA